MGDPIPSAFDNGAEPILSAHVSLAVDEDGTVYVHELEAVAYLRDIANLARSRGETRSASWLELAIAGILSAHPVETPDPDPWRVEQ